MEKKNLDRMSVYSPIYAQFSEANPPTSMVLEGGWKSENLGKSHTDMQKM